MQQPPLDRELTTAGITGKATETIAGNDAMAGHDDRAGIGAAGPPDGSGTGFELPCQLAVSHRAPGGELPQRGPNTSLKGRSPQAQGKIEVVACILEIGHQLFPDHGRQRIICPGRPVRLQIQSAQTAILHEDSNRPHRGIDQRLYSIHVLCLLEKAELPDSRLCWNKRNELGDRLGTRKGRPCISLRPARLCDFHCPITPPRFKRQATAVAPYLNWLLELPLSITLWYIRILLD